VRYAILRFDSLTSAAVDFNQKIHCFCFYSVAICTLALFSSFKQQLFQQQILEQGEIRFIY